MSALEDSHYGITTREFLKFFAGWAYCVGSWLFDIVSDIAIAVCHHKYGYHIFFVWTLALIIIPQLAITGLSLHWYYLDWKKKKYVDENYKVFRWTIRLTFTLLFMGSLARYLEQLIDRVEICLKSHKDMKEKKNMNKIKTKMEAMKVKDHSGSFLRLIETFMESAPQFALQLYTLALYSEEYMKVEYGVPTGSVWANKEEVLLRDIFAAILMILRCIITAGSISFTLLKYNGIQRLAHGDKRLLSIWSKIIMFCWRYFMISSRVIALAIFTLEHQNHVIWLFSIHWFVILIYLLKLETDFYDSYLEELIYNMVLSFIYFFCYFNPVEGKSRYRMAFFYVLMLIENSLIIYLSEPINPKPGEHDDFYADFSKHRLKAILAQYFCFFIGLMFCIIYYCKFHPNKLVKENEEDVESYRNKDKGNDKCIDTHL